MGLPICLEIQRFIEPTTVDTVGVDNIRPYAVPEDLLPICGADCNKICPWGGIIITLNADRLAFR